MIFPLTLLVDPYVFLPILSLGSGHIGLHTIPKSQIMIVLQLLSEMLFQKHYDFLTFFFIFTQTSPFQ